VPFTDPVYGLQAPLGTELLRNVDDSLRTLVTQLGGIIVGQRQGPLSSRGLPSRPLELFRDTGTGIIYCAAGGTWVALNAQPERVIRSVFGTSPAQGASSTATLFGPVSFTASRAGSLEIDLFALLVEGRVGGIPGATGDTSFQPTVQFSLDNGTWSGFDAQLRLATADVDPSLLAYAYTIPAVAAGTHSLSGRIVMNASPTTVQHRGTGLVVGTLRPTVS
jgi:hypothetical protein